MEDIIINADCLGTKGMPSLKPKSVDLIIADLPFEQTSNEWDKIVPFKPMWEQINRIKKDTVAVLLMGMQPFTTLLNASNLKEYRYEYIWKMKEKRNFLNANRMPLREHLNISVFYKKLPVYNPQKTEGHKPVKKYKQHTNAGQNYGKTKIGMEGGGQTDRYPTSVIDIPYKTIKIKDRIHSTQKPVELLEWLILTYSNPGAVVLDFTAGGCTTAVASITTGRKFICIEKDKEIFQRACTRVYGGKHQLKICV